jgi:flagellar biosynthesis/type III secretory pathway protein FliH
LLLKDRKMDMMLSHEMVVSHLMEEGKQKGLEEGMQQGIQQ